ncbi:6,7-dimethyl-8-ribityllumazine synthase [Candidatus Daviesbacteria bacterium]|nr:6,7-dimethyl-8-ribityllumazine synthase [Candidatus Daviesbacteria bacterium]
MSKNIAILATEFHKESMDKMVKEVRKTASNQGLDVVKEVWVPGCYEVPLALKRLFTSKNIDGAVILGIIEKGNTKHGLVMGLVVHNAIVRLEMETDKPVGMGILGPEILPRQIPLRLKPYAKRAVLALKTMLSI